jgi:hypothetical protein
METTQGNSLYSYLYLKPAKILCFSYYLLCFFYKIREQERGTNSAWRMGRRMALSERRDDVNNLYIVTKCKNDTC